MKNKRFRFVVACALVFFQFGLFARLLSAEEQQANLRMILPEKIYAVPGIETNLYYNNVVLVVNPANYVFDVHCAVGHLQSERWTITPKPEEVGEYDFKLNVLNANNEVIASQESKLIVVSPKAGENQEVRFLMVGDSLTQASVYPQQVRDLAKETKGLNLVLVGSHNPRNNEGLLHEGYGGWTAVRFATHYNENARTGNYRKRGSPFLYLNSKSGKPELDFGRYCEELNNSQSPDFVTIFLGPNDVYRCTDENIEETVNVMIEHLDLLIKMIRDYSKTTEIGLMLPVPAAATQDAFGTANGRRQTQWQYKRNQHRLVERLMSHYGKSDQVSLVPTHINIDTEKNYPSTEILRNSRSSLKVIRQNNAVHPSGTGYLQIGDSVYCWMKSRLALNSTGK